MGERGQPALTIRVRASLGLALWVAAAVVGGSPIAAAAATSARLVFPPPTFVAPAPGTSVEAGVRYRFGWLEAGSSPVLDRALTLSAGPVAPGGCRDAVLEVRWSRAGARVGEATIEDLPPDACVRLSVALTRVDGTVTTIASGSLRTAPAGPGTGPVAAFVSPGPGVQTLVPPIGLTFVRWEVAGGDPIAERYLFEERATPAASGACTAATDWQRSEEFVPSGSVHAVEGLEPGRCFRYLLVLIDESRHVSYTRSGAFLVTERAPACGFGSDRSALDPETAWDRLVLDTETGIDPSYVPGDLVDASRAGLASGFRIRALMVDDLRAMAAAAMSAGNAIALTSAFRDADSQARILAAETRRLGVEDALALVARPGHSEHQLGTAIDVTSAGGSPVAGDDWGSTAAGAWMAANASRFGFVRSYPEAAAARTCYRPEPWHYRYVGRAMAAAVAVSGLPLRVYLWRHRAWPAGD